MESALLLVSDFFSRVLLLCVEEFEILNNDERLVSSIEMFTVEFRLMVLKF